MAPLPHEKYGKRDDWDEEELSDEQIKALLQRAEQRLSNGNSKHSENTVVGAQMSQKMRSLNAGTIAQPYITSVDGVARADPRRLLSERYRGLANTPRRVEDPVVVKSRVAKENRASAGSDFFDMPRTNLTAELKADLQLLKMRSILDPHQHYKKDNTKSLVPEYSQVGKIVEGPTEYFSSRLPNKERRKTFVEEALADNKSTSRFKNKYGEIQASKTSGRKAHYKKLKAKRSNDIQKP